MTWTCHCESCPVLATNPTHSPCRTCCPSTLGFLWVATHHSHLWSTSCQGHWVTGPGWRLCQSVLFHEQYVVSVDLHPAWTMPGRWISSQRWKLQLLNSVWNSVWWMVALYGISYSFRLRTNSFLLKLRIACFRMLLFSWLNPVSSVR